MNHLYRIPQSERVEALRREADGRPPAGPPAHEAAAPGKPYRPSRGPSRADYVQTCGEFLGWPADRAGAAWDRLYGG